MGARKDNKGNGLYSTREQRRITQGHPDVDNIPPGPGSRPSVINPDQPLPTPRGFRERKFENTADAPIYLRWDDDDDRFYPPPLITDLRWESATLKRRLHEEILLLANSDFIAEEWMKKHAPQVNIKKPWSPLINGPDYIHTCKDSLLLEIPEIRINGNNLKNDKVIRYIDAKLSTIDLIDKNVRYARDVYSKFASIANDNFRGSSKDKKKVTLGRLIKALGCLPDDMSDDALLDVAFYGAIDASMIHMDRHAMSDLLVLTAALGQLRYGRFYPTREMAQTYLFVVGLEKDRSSDKPELALARRQLADRLLNRYKLAELQYELTKVCRSVIEGNEIDEKLQRIQFNIVP